MDGQKIDTLSPLIIAALTKVGSGHFAAPGVSVLNVSFPDSCRSKSLD